MHSNGKGGNKKKYLVSWHRQIILLFFGMIKDGPFPIFLMAVVVFLIGKFSGGLDSQIRFIYRIFWLPAMKSCVIKGV